MIARTLSTSDIKDILEEIEETNKQIMFAEGILDSLRKLKEAQEHLAERVQDINALRNEINDIDVGKEEDQEISP